MRLFLPILYKILHLYRFLFRYLPKSLLKKNTKKITREDILALLARGREIKARRQKEAEEWYAERMRRKQEAEESGYFNIEWS